MNKLTLIGHLATQTNLEKTAVEKILNALEETITQELKNNGEVVLTGFGTFSAKTRAGRIGVNPRNTSEKIEIKPTRVPKFKAGKSLKDALKK
jgi:DNA-binding protein HU-beta